MNEETLTQEILKELISYNQVTGLFYWNRRTNKWFVNGKRNADWQCKVWNKKFAGRVVGSKNAHGYLQTKILNGSWFKLHRLAWFYVHGVWPDTIDHINGITDDNKLLNLRNVSFVENMKNRSEFKNNTSGHRGVYYNKKNDKWTVEISGIYIGSFANKNNAIEARLNAEKQYGYHTNHGRKK